MQIINFQGVGGFNFQQVTPPSNKGIHYFIFENGVIRYAGPHLTPPAVPTGPGIQLRLPPDLSGMRYYWLTPVESPVVPETSGGGGGGTRPWGSRSKKVPKAIVVRRDAQDIMDLISLIICSGILEE